MAKKAGSKGSRSAKAKSRIPKAPPKKAQPAAKSALKTKKAKCPLTRAQLKKQWQALLAKRQAILGDMSGMEAEAMGYTRQRGSASGLSSTPTHPADVGTDNYEQEFTLGLLESERVLLAEIEEALARIDGGTYGVCLGTGEPINKARLEARPWAKYCIEYARLIEKGLVRPGEQDQGEQDQSDRS